MPSILKKICECCKRCYAKNYFVKHIKTNKHKKNLKKSLKRKEINEDIKDEATLFPTDILNIIMDYKEDIENNLQIHEIAESVNKQLERKINMKSNTIYSRDIKLDKKVKITTIRDILSANLIPDLYIQYLYRTTWVVKFDDNKMTKGISIQFNPMVHKSEDKLMVMFH